MLLDECINLFATLPIIADLNRLAVMTKMNTSLQTCVISMDVEDPSVPQCHTLGGGSLQILQTRVSTIFFILGDIQDFERKVVLDIS